METIYEPLRWHRIPPFHRRKDLFTQRRRAVAYRERPGSARTPSLRRPHGVAGHSAAEILAQDGCRERCRSRLSRRSHPAEIGTSCGSRAQPSRKSAADLRGRNFEYLSEDPVLSGELAATLIASIEAGGVAGRSQNGRSPLSDIANSALPQQPERTRCHHACGQQYPDLRRHLGAGSGYSEDCRRSHPRDAPSTTRGSVGGPILGGRHAPPPRLVHLIC